MKPITIAGGGLAGLATGIALSSRGVAVEIHEAGSYPRHRVCGEFISGLSEQTAATLGIESALADCRKHTETAWFIGDREIFSDSLPQPALAISRHTLDVRLTECFERSGGVLHQRSRFREAQDEGLVWATGRRATKGSPWVGLKAHFHGLPMSHGLEMHLGKGAYVGVTPVEDGRVNVCGLFKAIPSTRSRGSRRLVEAVRHAGMTALLQRLDRAEADEPSFTGVSAIRFGRQQAPTPRCSLGDAESMIPPFTGNGMTMAFQAAEMAIAPLVDYARNHCSWSGAVDRIRKKQHERFRRRLGFSQLLHPVLCSAPGQTAFELLTRSRLLPFQQLYRALR